jgi:hypothetical protein
MDDSTPRMQQNKKNVVKMKVEQLLPSQEVLEYIKCFARSYRPVAI